MYCPRCSVDNLDEASFCRSCGADISLVPQALTGRLPETPVTAAESKSRRGNVKGAKIEDAVSTMFVGLAFLLIVIGGAVFFRGGFMVWIWMLIPGFACLGSGVGKYMQFKHEREDALPPAAPATRASALFGSNAAHNLSALPARDTAEIVSSFKRAPTSVTEGTTRLLDTDAPPRNAARVPFAPTGDAENRT